MHQRSSIPSEINRDAPVVSDRTIVVRAPISAVWAVHMAVPDWPSWNPAVTRAEMDGPAGVGVSFRWSTAGMDITSTIHEIAHERDVLWSGTAGGILGVHHWTFMPVEDGVRVQTEESWEGGPVEGKEPELQAALDGSLDDWLARLKAHVERETQG